jgi:hypothetical protein
VCFSSITMTVGGQGVGAESFLSVGHTKKKVYVIALCFGHEVSVKTKFYNHI